MEDMDGSVGRQALFVVVAVLFAYGIYSTAGQVMGTAVPVVAVTTDSMVPALHPGDMILVEGVDIEQVRENDIIVFETPSMPIPVIHRVVDVNGSVVQTRGDNNPGQLPWEKHITESQIKGRSILSVPFVGYVKLVPTCVYLHLQGYSPGQLNVFCPDIVLAGLQAS